MGGFKDIESVIKYRSDLKEKARALRKNMTQSERRLWAELRGKQILGVQFYRQKPIGKYIVDFFAPKVNLVIEVDGSQHLNHDHAFRDKQRDNYLNKIGLKVLRFDNRQILKEIESVREVIYKTMKKALTVD